MNVDVISEFARGCKFVHFLIYLAMKGISMWYHQNYKQDTCNPGKMEKCKVNMKQKNGKHKYLG